MTTTSAEPSVSIDTSTAAAAAADAVCSFGQKYSKKGTPSPCSLKEDLEGYNNNVNQLLATYVNKYVAHYGPTGDDDAFSAYVQNIKNVINQMRSVRTDVETALNGMSSSSSTSKVDQTKSDLAYMNQLKGTALQNKESSDTSDEIHASEKTAYIEKLIYVIFLIVGILALIYTLYTQDSPSSFDPSASSSSSFGSFGSFFESNGSKGSSNIFKPL